MTINNLSDTVKTKSDQLNADDLIAGPVDVMITGIRRGSADQPIIIDIDGGYMPFKPCKTVRRILIKGWGDNGHDWVGKSMKIYNDPSVKWAGVAIGGIRVSHMSDIQPFEAVLNASAKHKAKHSIQLLVPQDFTPVINQFNAEQDEEKRNALWASYSPAQQQAIQNSINGVK